MINDLAECYEVIVEGVEHDTLYLVTYHYVNTYGEALEIADEVKGLGYKVTVYDSVADKYTDITVA